MPTRNRRRFISQSIWYFLRQDYSRKELIVVDDGEDCIADLIPADERIRYLRLDRRLSIGAKRNLACEISNGEIVAHWDDDDWIGPRRLSRQVGHLVESGASVCGAADLLHYKPEAGEAWLYRSAPGSRPSVAGGTLLYKRSVWLQHRFPDIDVGEDAAFVWQQPADRVGIVDDASFYVALIHRGNTSAKRLSDPRWERRPLEEVAQRIAPDRDFYVELRTGAPPASRPATADSVTVAAPFLVYDGYGSMSEFVVLGMQRAGACVNVVPFELDPVGLSPEFRRIVSRSKPQNSAPTLYFCWPRPDLERFRGSSELFTYTMWESSQLPRDWAPRLNAMRAVMVPTRFCARVCRDSGVDVPIHVVPLGVDPVIYSLRERSERAGVTSLVVGTFAGRKHVAEAIAGWTQAFADDPDARLIIKSRFGRSRHVLEDPRVRVVDANETSRGIAHWYEQADVLIAVGNEGFGLPLVEAMATGLPVVALNSEGQADLCEDAGEDLVLTVAPERWEASNDPPFGPAGVRGVPDVRAIADRLRWVATHRAAARQMGRAAAAWVTEHRNIWNAGPAVLDVIEQRVGASTALRQRYTLLVPSWRTPCGVAEYSRHICDSLPGVEAIAGDAQLRRIRVLHVQHEPSLFDAAALTSLLQQARIRHVPIVVTEHAVMPQPAAWEREADALVALSPSGERILRARWPQKRVECIPCGCPTWFPPRKARRGRVIGAFGFLETHKGFWKLLDVLKKLPDTELLLVSHARNPRIEAEWRNATAGRRVRRYDQFLPVEEAARLLAAEADVLAYWYDEAAHASASSAIRVGLASGVPVVASPTRWFEDLRGVTRQPADLLTGIAELLEDESAGASLSAAARDYCHEHSWRRIASRHLQLWQSLETHHETNTIYAERGVHAS